MGLGEKEKKWNREGRIKEEITKADSGIEERVERDNEGRTRIIRKGTEHKGVRAK